MTFKKSNAKKDVELEEAAQAPINPLFAANEHARKLYEKNKKKIEEEPESEE
jgi:hypothetical protein